MQNISKKHAILSCKQEYQHNLPLLNRTSGQRFQLFVPFAFGCRVQRKGVAAYGVRTYEYLFTKSFREQSMYLRC